mmetsp:Transcript_92807/g.193991  ORF Transcript_92807/g.193991 Transcript_92807/m.193991 type:complete len:393 (+) Transcript_92807:156-1334(+)
MPTHIPARETAALQHRLLPDPHGRKPKLGLSRSNPSLHHIDRLEQIRQHREDIQRTVYDFSDSDFGGLSWSRSTTRRSLYKAKALAKRYPHPSQVDLRERVEASEKLEEGLKPECLEKLDEIQDKNPRLGLYLPTLEKFSTHEHKFGTGGHDTGPDLEALPQSLQQQECEMIASARSGASSGRHSPTSKTVHVINTSAFTIVSSSDNSNDNNNNTNTSADYNNPFISRTTTIIGYKKPALSVTEFPALNLTLGEAEQTARPGGFRQTAPAVGFFRGAGSGTGDLPLGDTAIASIRLPIPGVLSPTGTFTGTEASPTRSLSLSGTGFGLRSRPRMLPGPVVSRTGEVELAAKSRPLSNSASAPELRKSADRTPPPVWSIPSWNKVTLKTLVQC